MGAATTPRRRALFATAAAVGTFAVGWLSPAAARAAVPGLVTDLTWGIPSADQDRTVGAMRDVGAKWTRLQIQWKAWETSPGVYAPWEVSRTDRAIQLCRGAGIHVLLDVVNAPAWASNTNDPDLGNVPRSTGDFARFMRYVAARYRGQVEAYEIWNEPDIRRFWNTGPNAAAYTELLKAGYTAVKSADPTANVVSGGLSWDYVDFLGAMYAAGAKGYFDVLGLHPYPVGPLSGWQASYRKGRQTELAHGDDKPIWLTEFGVNTATDPDGWQPGVSLEQQAAEVTAMFTLLEEDPYVQVALYYNLRNDWWLHDAMSDMEAQFGLMDTSFAPKPSYYAFKTYALARGSTSTPPPPSPQPLDTPPQVALTSPAGGSTFTSRLSLAASAADDHGVGSVRFYVDRQLVATDLSPPYAFTWSVPTSLAYGSHTATAVATDTAGQTVAASTPVTRVRKKRNATAATFAFTASRVLLLRPLRLFRR